MGFSAEFWSQQSNGLSFKIQDDCMVVLLEKALNVDFLCLILSNQLRICQKKYLEIQSES